MDNEYNDFITIPMAAPEDCMIKVMGVGGGGCNAVNHLYDEGFEGISYLVCNTDRQQLVHSTVPAHLQLGPGWGAGGKPEVARKYAEDNRDAIHDALNDGTQMLFITAGQGGGTGTGASPIVAEVAREMNILTVGIVTIPFAFEGNPKIRKAMAGVAQLADRVDAILVINNEKLRAIYPDLDTPTGFKKADEVLANAAHAIAEIITVQGIINTDFADVYNTLKDGHVALMNVGRASGEERISAAISNALNSPLANSNDVRGAKRILIQLYCSSEHAIRMEEYDQIHRFVAEVGPEVEVQWGISLDESLGEDVRITIIATGYEVSDIPTMRDEVGAVSIDEAIEQQYANTAAPVAEEKPKNEDEEPVQIEFPIHGEETAAPAPAAPQSQPTSVQGADGQGIIVFDDDSPEDIAAKAQEPSKPRHRWFR